MFDEKIQQSGFRQFTQMGQNLRSYENHNGIRKVKILFVEPSEQGIIHGRNGNPSNGRLHIRLPVNGHNK
jgi:hypothetical protein